MDLDQLLDAVRQNGTRIVDSHVHPLDVLGVVYPDYAPGGGGDFLLRGERPDRPVDFRRPVLNQRLGHGRIASLLTDLAMRALPGVVRAEIEGAYRVVGAARLRDELEAARVDSAVLLSVEPWSSARQARELYGDGPPLLGSLDLHRLGEEEIEGALLEQIEELGIIGLKLHPNLQGFLPRPRDNPPELAARLRRLYALAAEHGLYLLFHGGPSSLVSRQHPGYPAHPWARRNAVLARFFDAEGGGELVELCRCPVVIAHLGAFGVASLDEGLIERALARNDNVYFDTSAMSSRLIARFLDLFGHGRLLFGSDGFYNRTYCAMQMVHAAVLRSRHRAREVEAMGAILGGNFAAVVAAASA